MVKAKANILPYSEQDFFQRNSMGENSTQIRLKFKTLSFWVLVLFCPLWRLLSQKQ